MTLEFSQSSEILVRLVAAAVLGGLIGLERDIHGRAAGLRTHLIVSLGAAVFTVLSLNVSQLSSGNFPADPARIAAQIVSGIGFLGAGAIIKEGTNVHGLTTAACLWGAAAIGMAAGGGYYEIAIMTTVIALISLVVLKLAERVYRKDSYRTLIVQTPIEVSSSQIIAIVERRQLKILKCDIDKDYQTGIAVTKLLMRLHHRGVADKIAHTIISSIENSGIKLQEVHWEQV